MNDEKVRRNETGSLPRLAGRRRFLATGITGGVLASLKSGSALASGVCASPSSFTSITLNPATSHRPQQLPTCHSHGYWKNKAWPISQQTTVGQAGFCIGSRLTALGITSDTKLIDILNMQGGGGDRALAADLISAYLDAAAGYAQGQFTTADIQKMWGLVFCGQPYSVNGTAWSEQTVRAFLDVLVGNSPWP
ncbi:hypothetical protein [Sulfuricystis multivorans]|uniref:hypothetical protein n=1 Tax=Sulfuricystis multivorans TaxID=2211108 RepID=UPI000F82DC51|nr:hypothetical protein [Sulfuricystis multivorans]